MKKKISVKVFLLLICLFHALVGMAKENIVSSDITKLYQPDKQIQLVQEDLLFWENKISTSPNQSSYLLKLSSAYQQLFSLTSQIQDLKKAESLLQAALTTTLINRSSALRALAHNYITQHRFCEALDLLLEAVEIGENKFANNKMLFDVYLELGEQEQARIQLTKITNNSNFDYLIRKSKWEDSKGNLLGAITYLERAKKKARATNNKALLAWIYANLGDYYGHNGEIKRSYEHFKQALEIEPSNWYALKGIAWIAYAQDRNIVLPKQLIQTVLAKNSSPDLHLQLAELATYTNNKQDKNSAVTNFQKMIQQAGYGDMYNKYECLIAAEYDGNFKAAYALVQQEINNRPTTESYDLLAWILFLDGKIETAQKIAKTQVLGQTSEPAILLHLAYIFQDEPTISRPILKDLEEAYFELGPLKTKEIKAMNSKITGRATIQSWLDQLTPKIANPFWFLG